MIRSERTYLALHCRNDRVGIAVRKPDGEFALFTCFVAWWLSTKGLSMWIGVFVAMAVGFATSYPANWWLVRSGVKEAM